MEPHTAGRTRPLEFGPVRNQPSGNADSVAADRRSGPGSEPPTSGNRWDFFWLI
ncbi:hypothetical protein FACS189472_07560 [Alphaproteobacteria bacterium]|nr:hypothetical protein FACS189472_07560 [Alphaproteobacteria bacterium]